MKKLLLMALLIVIGCATRQKITSINILDGKISSGSTTLTTDDVKEECKIECRELTVSPDEWCDCMNQCSKDVLNKISFGNMDMRIYLEDCPVNP